MSETFDLHGNDTAPQNGRAQPAEPNADQPHSDQLGADESYAGDPAADDLIADSAGVDSAGVDSAADDPAADSRSADWAWLSGKRVALAGKLAGMSKRAAQQLLRARGAMVCDACDDAIDLVIAGEDAGLSADQVIEQTFATAAASEANGSTPSGNTPSSTARERIRRGALLVLSESEVWQRLGLVDAESNIRRLYTPAMLADLVKVPVTLIRRWHRRKLIVPLREVRRLAYFDFQEVAIARRLAELSAAGVSAAALERMLASLGRQMPQVARPLVQLSIVVEGKQLLLRQGDELVEPHGQLRFDFDALADEAISLADEAARTRGEILSLAARRPQLGTSTEEDESPPTPEKMLELATELEEVGYAEAAAEMYRAAMAAGGPTAEACFRLAELLYQQGEPAAARERYYMAIELDEDYVEARANLGCVLAEAGERDLAVAAFEGALRFHGDYADVHYHLAHTLDSLDRRAEAEEHWNTFVRLAPESPWADEARDRLSRAEV